MVSARSSRLQQAVWGPLSSKVRQSRRLREPAIAGYRALARVAFRGAPPKVLANSIPKSGTHLLTQVLSNVPDLRFNGVHITHRNFVADDQEFGDGRGAVDVELFERLLRRTHDGQYFTGHLAAYPEVLEALGRHQYRTIFMIRDPRDIVVSQSFYHAKTTKTHVHDRFAAMSGPEERIMAAITGLPGREGEPALTPLGDRLERYRAWLTDPLTCVVRFEDLVGESGGGSREAQLTATRQLLAHCQRPTDDAVVARVADAAFARHTPTFRRGVIGDWRNHLTAEHLAAIDERAPGLLAAYGYGD